MTGWREPSRSGVRGISVTTPGTGPTEHERRSEVADAAQRVAGVLAARHRADATGVRTLLGTFPDDGALAGGSLLLADLALRLVCEQSGETMEQCVRRLTARLGAAVASAG